jgi:hypothetical protein
MDPPSPCAGKSILIALLRAEATRHGVSIRADPALKLPGVADRVQIQRVPMNLILNGIKTMHDTGGVLTVKSHRRTARSRSL